MAVLGPYSAADKVEVIYRTSSGGTGRVQADFRRARDAYYSVSQTTGCTVPMASLVVDRGNVTHKPSRVARA